MPSLSVFCRIIINTSKQAKDQDFRASSREVDSQVRDELLREDFFITVIDNGFLFNVGTESPVKFYQRLFLITLKFEMGILRFWFIQGW